MDASDLIEPGAGARSATELATLLLELGRVVKARRFYAPGDARLVPVFERGLRAWRADLSRRGALEIEVLAEGIRERAGRGVLSHAKLAQLRAELRRRGVERLRIEPSLDAEAFAGLIEVLANEGTADPPGGFAAALYALAPVGIAVNEREAASAAPEEAGDEDAGDEEALEFLDEPKPSPPPVSARAPEPPRPPTTLELELTAPEAAADEESPFDAPPFELALREEPAAEDEPLESSELERAPLERSIPDDRSAELVDVLRELNECDSVSQYVELARQAVRLAERAADEGRLDDCYRVMLVLSEHATAKGSERHQEVAQSFLGGLAQGPRLQDLIDRACSGGDASSVKASQVLLQLGEDVVRPLLDAAERERDAKRRGHMHGVLIAMGEKILPELLRVMEQGDVEAMKSALRLAGETQNPDAVPRLTQLLDHANAGVREEAAKSLVRIGSERAVDALIRSLRSRTAGVPELAVYCLGATGQLRAVSPLVQALNAAVDERDADRAREIIRSLGRLGRAEATGPLAELVHRKNPLGRRWLRDLKVAAIAALGGLPGDEAVGALAQAAQSKDAQLRRAAQVALDRRAQSLARGRS